MFMILPLGRKNELIKVSLQDKMRFFGILEMTKLYAKLMFLGLSISFLCISSADAATIYASSCSRSDVQAAMNSASTGDTVVVPAGQCTWNGSVTIPTGVILQGAGIGQTVISGSGAILNTNSRLTGFEFATNVDLGVVDSAQNWRIDHNKIQQSGSQNTWILIRSNCGASKVHSSGLIDNNTIVNGRTGVFGCSDIFQRMSD